MKIKHIKNLDTTTSQHYKFFAVDENNKLIFGTEVSVSRYKRAFIDEWTKWEINFGSGNGDIKFMEIKIEVINKAINFAKKLNNNMKTNKLIKVYSMHEFENLWDKGFKFIKVDYKGYFIFRK